MFRLIDGNTKQIKAPFVFTCSVNEAASNCGYTQVWRQVRRSRLARGSFGRGKEGVKQSITGLDEVVQNLQRLV